METAGRGGSFGRGRRIPGADGVVMGTGDRGFFLLEGMLAAALLGVGLLGIMGLEAAALRHRGATREQLEALALAMGALERAGLREGCAGHGVRRQGRMVYEIEGTGSAGRATVRVAWGAGQGARSLALSRRSGF